MNSRRFMTDMGLAHPVRDIGLAFVIGLAIFHLCQAHPAVGRSDQDRKVSRQVASLAFCAEFGKVTASGIRAGNSCYRVEPNKAFIFSVELGGARQSRGRM